MEQHLSPQQVADRLGMSRKWVLLNLKPGGIYPFVALNARTYLIPESSVVAFLEKRKLGRHDG